VVKTAAGNDENGREVMVAFPRKGKMTWRPRPEEYIEYGNSRTLDVLSRRLQIYKFDETGFQMGLFQQPKW
jgi:hypothetical protein